MDESPEAVKRCIKCGFTCDISVAGGYFSRNRRRKDGLQGQCKRCVADYQAAHREERRVYDATNYQMHREERLAYAYTHYKETRDRYIAHYKAHREESCARSAAYRQTEKGRLVAKAAKHNRRARIKATGGALSPADVALILKAHTDSKGRLRCAKCGRVIEGQQYHLDHFIPLSKGGTNDPGNIRVMHRKCNQDKTDKLPYEIGMLI